MREKIIACGAMPTSRKGGDVIELDASPQASVSSRVVLRLDHISVPMADNLPPVLADALELATYVFAADQLVARGSPQMSGVGASWRRKFRFAVPVRELEIWSSGAVQEALCEALGFLTEDEFTFDFGQGESSVGLEPYLNFSDPEAQRVVPDEVILFSGGLDSLAGTLDRLVGDQSGIALVSHQSSPLLTSRQNGLINAISSRVAGRNLFYVPVTVRRGSRPAVEFSQRSRSFLFASLGAIVALMFGRSSVQFFENGIVSFNLPIAEHVLGSRASRTTHPRTLSAFSKLFSILLEKTFTFENPFIWMTKKDVVQLLARHDWVDLLKNAFSCAAVREAAKTGKHCGVCSQCLERRFGVLAAGLEEPKDTYAFDMFCDEHFDQRHAAMAESFILRAHKIRSMPEQTFLARYGQVFRALEHLPGAAHDNCRKIYELHRRHAHDVIAVVDHELAKRANLDELLRLPPRSLLNMIRAPLGVSLAQIDEFAQVEEPAVTPASAGEQSRIAFGVNDVAGRVYFSKGVELGGAGYRLIRELALDFKRDMEARISPRERRFISGRKLAGRLGWEEQTLRQRVSRTRRVLADRFDKAGTYLDPEDVIQTQNWAGYRLNPYLLLVDALQLAPESSQHSARTVTTPTSQC